MQERRMLAFKDGIETVQYDYRPFAEESGDVTAVDWVIKYGNAGISNESLSNNVATATISTPEEGSTLIQLKATTRKNQYITTLELFAKDPENQTLDYGLCHG